jgi:hypothetical protein
MWTYYNKHDAQRNPSPANWLVKGGIVALGTARIVINAVRRKKRVSRR